MNNLQVIYTQDLFDTQFNIYGSVDEPLFLAKDVAEWIKHSNARMMLKTVDEDEKVCVNNPYALKGQQEQWFLTEDGLYEVLMQSRKPIAKQFKKKVKEILKGLRRGELKIMSNELSNQDMQTLVQSIVESNNNTAACMQQMTQMMSVMLQLVQNNTNINTNTTPQTETQTEKEYIDSCVGPVTGKFYTMSDIAKDITKETGIICDAKKLNRFLCANDIIIRAKGYEYNKQIHNNIYILAEQYRDTYDTLITPGIKKYTNEFYLSNVYRGNFRQFVISTVKNNKEKFINS